MKEFQSIEELVAFADHIIEREPERLDQLSEELMTAGETTRLSRQKKPILSAETKPAPRFSAWLTLYGKKPVR